VALGAAEVNLLDLTAAYAAVQAGKMPIKPWGISGFGVEGQSRFQSMGPPIGGTQTLSPYQKPLLELMQEVLHHGTGRAAALDGFAAGKTGTSQNYRDAWFIGFNDTLTVGVWVGNDDRTPMNRVTGGSLPAAIWKRFMTEAATVMARDTQQPASGAATATARDTQQPASGAATATARDAQQATSGAATATARDTQQATSGAAPKAADTARAQTPADQAVSAAPYCDYQACARSYQSFRASDCTYQPYSGASRRQCDKDPSQRTAATLFAPGSHSQPLPEQSSKARCRLDVCASFYDSFDPTDCTYRPLDGGPRRLCSR